MLLDLIRTGEATTRSQLAHVTGLSRSTVATRVEHLLAEDSSPRWVRRRRAVAALRLSSGSTRRRGWCSQWTWAPHTPGWQSPTSASPIGETAIDLDIASGPENVLGTIDRVLISLLDSNERGPGEVKGIGIGVPGPVEYAAGRAVTPPIMPGWDGYPIRDRFVDRYHVPVLVDNDVNIMARGEHWVTAEPSDDFLFVKVGTGIGSADPGRRLHRGARGQPATSGISRSPPQRGSCADVATRGASSRSPADGRWLPDSTLQTPAR